MNRVLFSVLAIFTTIITMVFSLIMVIPLTIAAVITGKQLQNKFKADAEAASYQQRSAIEGEFEDVSENEVK
ncbi:hypothetical protein MACH09_32510 [Vibrio sp. MACH09]|uniref:hypothetical protein n=1 Tax=unclassified Vibrio TaxID=2614977 RepID=UPI0014939744|nr:MULTISPECIES: hypothetical protein [unclassified Vibrio]NOI65800.1 hypothetical protein [Vibrio sp. 99-8-1]GLO62743.1 hypothetical protein MACH09_32510 [Vibrio sp. MACH09]